MLALEDDRCILVTEAIRAVCRLLPLFIFASFSMQIWESGIKTLASLWKPIVLCAAVCAVLLVTGGTMACVGILIKQLGLPGEVMAIAGLLSLVLDFIATGFSLGLRHLELLLQADHLDMLDYEVLRK